MDIQTKILITYLIVTYLMMIGVLLEDNDNTDMFTKIISFLCAPILIPVMIGGVLGK